MKARKMYHKTVLKNGIKIITEKLEYFRSVSLGIWVKAGSRDELEEENGISHFVEHMIFKGTDNRDGLQIAKELDAIGGLSNAFTGKEYTCFHSKVLDKHFSTLADILSDIFLNSIFDSQDMDRERQVILQEIGMTGDTPDEHIHVLFNRLFWSDHPLGMSILGSNETVSSINKETILQYIKKFYTPDRIIISAAGNIDHETVVEYFQPLFETLEPRSGDHSSSPPHIKSDVLCHYKDLEQVHICVGGRGPHFLSELRFAGAILNTILGGNMSSRLFQEIREKRGLAYSIYSFLSTYMDTGLMGVYAGTDPQEVNHVLRVVNTEIKKIQEGEISKSDLSEVKEHLIGGILLGAERTDNRMIRLARNEYVFGRYLTDDELVSNLEKVTIDEVVSVAKKAFSSEKISLVTLGPIKKEDVDLSCLHFSDN